MSKCRWLCPSQSRGTLFAELWHVNGMEKRLIWERVVVRKGEERRARVEPGYSGWIWGVSYADLSCGVPYERSTSTLRAAMAAADAGLELPPWWKQANED